MHDPAAGGGPVKPESGVAQLDLALERISQVLHNVRYETELPSGLKGHVRLAELLCDLAAIRKFLMALSRGELGERLACKGVLAGALKGLQSNLHHLTWQTRMVAGGDYSQRVEFMGDFAEAFNSMAAQLGQAMADLRNSQAELLQKNRELSEEIQQRKALEADLRLSEEKYRRQAVHDDLTGLYNRRHFLVQAVKEASRQKRRNGSLALLLLDIDHFKSVNDRYGHAAGDIVLRGVAELVINSLRKGDMGARYGGEEMVLLLADTDLAGAMRAAERLRRDIADMKMATRSGEICVTVSLGVAMLSCSEQADLPLRRQVEEGIRRADEAMYQAKETGRNRVCACEVDS